MLPVLVGALRRDGVLQLDDDEARLCDGWIIDPSMSIEDARQGITRLRQGFLDAGRDPNAANVRWLLTPVWDDHRRIDVERTFDNASEALDAGVNVVAFPLPPGYGSMFDSMADVGRFVSSIGRAASSY